MKWKTKGKEIEIADMSIPHLKSAINYMTKYFDKYGPFVSKKIYAEKMAILLEMQETLENKKKYWADNMQRLFSGHRADSMDKEFDRLIEDERY